MDLSFYKNLSKEQLNYANQIATKAREIGVPPELAVSIAYKESGLNPNVQPGSAGEIGIMQIKPTTGKEVGFSLDDLKNPEINIEAGLKYLKKSLDMSDGDYRLAAAGYNAGINHPFFSSKDQSLPGTTVNYLRDLKDFGAFSTQPAKEAKPAQPTQPTEPDMDVDKLFEDVARGRGEMAGLGAGAAESLRRTVPPVVKGAAKFLGKAAEEGRLAADIRAGFGPRQMPPAPLGGSMAPGIAQESTQANRILQGTTEPDFGTTGRARQSGYNIETAQQAARAKQQAQNIGALQRSGILSQTAPDVLAKAPGMTATPSGVVYPRTSPSAPPIPEPPSKGALEKVTGIFERMMEPTSKVRTIGGTVFRYAAPPLAGLQAGSEIGSMIHEAGKEKPDYVKMGLSGLGALGAGMSAFPGTAGIGIPLAIGAPAIQRFRELPKRPDYPTEVNPMGDYVGP